MTPTQAIVVSLFMAVVTANVMRQACGTGFERSLVWRLLPRR